MSISGEKFAQLPLRVVRDPTIPARAKELYALLASHVRADGSCLTVWPGYKHLAAEMGASTDTVGRAMGVLVERKLVARKRRLGTSWLTQFLPLEQATLVEPKLPEYSIPQSCGPYDRTEAAGSRRREVDAESSASVPTRGERESDTKDIRPRHPWPEDKRRFELSPEDEAWEEGHRRQRKPQVAHNTKEFKARAEKFRDEYNAVARETGWTVCSSMYPIRRKQLFERIEDGSLADLDAVWKGLRQKAQEGLTRDVDWLLRSPVAGASLTERSRRVTIAPELRNLPPLQM